MSENENVTDIEVPNCGHLDPRKKAVNVEDLVFVRQYIDKKMSDQVPGMIEDSLSEYHYTKTEADETFYKKSDTVENAKNSEHANTSTNADNAGHATTANSANEAAHATSADSATNAQTAAEATHAVSADEATNSGYATNAGHATNATSADDAKLLNGHNISKSEEGRLQFDGEEVVANKAVSSDSSGYATSAGHADTAGIADDSKKVNGAELKLDSEGYLMNGETEVSVYTAGEAVTAGYATEAGIADDSTLLNGHEYGLNEYGRMTIDKGDVYVHRADEAGMADDSVLACGYNLSVDENKKLTIDGNEISVNKANHADTINGYEVEVDSNGAVKIDGVIVPQKKELSFTVEKPTDRVYHTMTIVNLVEDITDGEKLEIIVSFPSNKSNTGVYKRESFIALCTSYYSTLYNRTIVELNISMCCNWVSLSYLDTTTATNDGNTFDINYDALSGSSETVRIYDSNNNPLRTLGFELGKVYIYDYSKTDESGSGIRAYLNTEYNIEKIYKIVE